MHTSDGTSAWESEDIVAESKGAESLGAVETHVSGRARVLELILRGARQEMGYGDAPKLPRRARKRALTAERWPGGGTKGSVACNRGKKRETTERAPKRVQGRQPLLDGEVPFAPVVEQGHWAALTSADRKGTERIH
jgi:hypothetical protein